jgi:hypothetical protein
LNLKKNFCPSFFPFFLIFLHALIYTEFEFAAFANTLWKSRFFLLVYFCQCHYCSVIIYVHQFALMLNTFPIFPFQNPPFENKNIDDNTIFTLFTTLLKICFKFNFNPIRTQIQSLLKHDQPTLPFSSLISNQVFCFLNQSHTDEQLLCKTNLLLSLFSCFV